MTFLIKMIIRNTVIRQLAILAISIFLFSCSSDEPLSDEAQLRAIIKEMEVGAQERSTSSVTKHISINYKDHQGNDLDRIKKMIRLQFLRNQNINIFTKINELEVLDDAATIELSIAMSSGKFNLSDATNRLKADTFRFSLVFMREDETWLLQSGSWQRGW